MNMDRVLSVLMKFVFAVSLQLVPQEQMGGMVLVLRQGTLDEAEDPGKRYCGRQGVGTQDGSVSIVGPEQSPRSWTSDRAKRCVCNIVQRILIGCGGAREADKPVRKLTIVH